MSLSSTFKSEFSKVSGSAETIRLAESDRQLVCEIVCADTVGCEFTTLRLHSDKLQGAPLSELRRLSQQLADRVTYLLEPIGPGPIPLRTASGEKTRGDPGSGHARGPAAARRRLRGGVTVGWDCRTVGLSRNSEYKRSTCVCRS